MSDPSLQGRWQRRSCKFGYKGRNHHREKRKIDVKGFVSSSPTLGNCSIDFFEQMISPDESLKDFGGCLALNGDLERSAVCGPWWWLSFSYQQYYQPLMQISSGYSMIQLGNHWRPSFEWDVWWTGWRKTGKWWKNHSIKQEVALNHVDFGYDSDRLILKKMSPSMSKGWNGGINLQDQLVLERQPSWIFESLLWCFDEWLQ